MNEAVWSWLRHAVFQVGRRGAFLAFLAILDILFGYSIFSVPRAALYLALWLQHIPSAWVSVVVWLAFAVIVVLVAGWPEALPGALRALPDVPEEVQRIAEGDGI